MAKDYDEINKHDMEAIEEMAEGHVRHLKGIHRKAFVTVAVAWSLFQLALPQVLLLGSVYVRCIHLAFAITLVYLSHPFLRGEEGPLRFLRIRDRIPVRDYFLAVAAGCAALYLAWDFVGIGARQGLPNGTDRVMGLLLIIFLLDAARRALGPALPTVASLFIGYSFVSEYMPEIISFKNATLDKLLFKLVLSTEGIYGVPLDVSASTVFLFVLFGAVLDKAGGGKYFINLAFAMVGKYKGGPGKAAVLASGLTGLVSGSSIANTVTTGTFTIPLMKRSGYPAVKAGAIEVAASTNGQLMPPIMGAAAFIIAEYCNMSYFDVVRAAFIPAVISYITLIYITHLEASKLGLRGLKKEDLPDLWKTFVGGLHFMIPLLFLIYQLMVLRRSPELSAYYAILILMGLILIREMMIARENKQHWIAGLKRTGDEIAEALISGAQNMMGIGVAVATAGIIVGIVTLGVGAVITDVIDVVSGGHLIPLLFITAVVSLILGMGLPTTANYIVMATLTVPVILDLAGDAGLVVPLIAAHLFCFYFGILADDTPPVALAAYAASAISKADPLKTGIQGFTYDLRTAILPFMFIFNTDLLLVGITGWWHIAVIFFTALTAMFAFAAFTQGWFFTKCKLWESLGLAGVTLILLRPELVAGMTPLPGKFSAYAAGTVLFGAIYGIQRWRVGQSATAAPG